jgi:hypothetical protein
LFGAARKLMFDPQRSIFVTEDIIFNREGHGWNCGFPVASFVQFGENHKPSQVAFAEWITRTGGFPFRDLN